MFNNRIDASKRTTRDLSKKKSAKFVAGKKATI